MKKLPALPPKLTPILLFIGMILLLLIKLRTSFNFYDEGFAMFGPIRILSGDLPYKDFWAIYPPGQFYIIAALIKLFGPNLINARLYDTLIRVLIVLGAWLIARRVTSPRMALLSAAIVTFLLASAGFYSYAVFPAMGLGIWAIWSWLKFSERDETRWLLLAGVLLGIATVIRWDIGAYATFSVFCAAYALLLSRAWVPTADAPAVPFRLGLLLGPLARLVPLLAPMLLIALSAYTLIGLSSGWQNLYEQVFYFPAAVLHSVRWLAYPTLRYADWIPDADWLRFYFPLFTFAIALVVLLVTAIRRRTRLERPFFALIALLIFGTLLFNQALSRYDIIHVTPASIFTFIIAAALFQRAAPPARPALLRSLAGVLLFALTALYFPPALKDLLATLDYQPPWKCQSQLPIASCSALNPDEEKAAAYIQSKTQPGEAIFVGNQKHNRIFVNDIGFYYLASRPSASRYHELYPGVATTLPIQQQIVNELESQKVTWLVLVKLWDSTEPNDSALDSQVYFLDEYIQAHYSVETSFGMYRIVKRNPN